MAFAPQYSGSSYTDIEADVFLAADRINGKALAIDGVNYPKLSWGQMVALVSAWRRAVGRSTVKWAGWYDLTKWALGWSLEGDKFRMTKEWANKIADPDTAARFWTETRRLAKELDAAGTKIAPLYIDWSWAGYEAAARAAWNVMKVDREVPAEAPEPTMQPDPGPAKTPDPSPSESTGNGSMILLVVLLIAAGMSKKKG